MPGWIHARRCDAFIVKADLHDAVTASYSHFRMFVSLLRLFTVFTHAGIIKVGVATVA